MASTLPKIRNGERAVRIAMMLTFGLTLAYAGWYHFKNAPKSIPQGALAEQARWLSGQMAQQVEHMIDPNVQNSPLKTFDLSEMGFEQQMLQSAVIQKRIGLQAGYRSDKGDCVLSLVKAHNEPPIDVAPTFSDTDGHPTAHWKQGDWEYWLLGTHVPKAELQKLSDSLFKGTQPEALINCGGVP